MLQFRHVRFRRHAIFLLAFFATAIPAFAGTICGQLTDAQSSSPVANAAVVLRDSTGAYTGLLTASDAQGDFCLEGVSPGTYTLEIRVDDYLVAFRNGVVVADDVSAVPVSLQMPPFSLAPPWPNPASGSVNLRLQMLRAAPVDMTIHDSRGRLVHRWRAEDAAVGSQVYLWDGRDRSGRQVPAGMYLIRVRTEQYTVTRPLLMVR